MFFQRYNPARFDLRNKPPPPTVVPLMSGKLPPPARYTLLVYHVLTTAREQAGRIFDASVFAEALRASALRLQLTGVIFVGFEGILANVVSTSTVT